MNLDDMAPLTSSHEPQVARHVLMVRPVRFASNPTTLATNHFQMRDGEMCAINIQRQALTEFDGMVQKLRDVGISVFVYNDTLDPHTPDSLFANNWVSFHCDGTLVIYPLLASNRNDEIRPDIIHKLEQELGVQWSNVQDLSHLRDQGDYLEGTGSLVLDRSKRVAYACLSPRTTLRALERFAKQLDYEVVSFQAFGENGAPLYHTNIVMGIGSDFFMACLEAIPCMRERSKVESKLLATGRDFIPLSMHQMNHFAGNFLALETESGERQIALSERAFQSLDRNQLARLSVQGRIIRLPLTTVEDYGGGGARCMLTEIFLPAFSES